MATEIVRTAINVEQWVRKNHFNFYRDFQDPNFNICFSMDITSAYQFAKQHQLSPFLVLMYLSSQACNSVEAFKIRMDKQKLPYLVSQVEPSVTVAEKDGLFNFCNMEHHPELTSFININSKCVEASLAAEPLADIDNKDNQIFYSVVPWLNFTGYKHVKGSEYLDTPRIVFGKIEHNNGMATMPVSVELHHAIADAIDIAKYQQCFTEYSSQLV